MNAFVTSKKFLFGNKHIKRFLNNVSSICRLYCSFPSYEYDLTLKGKSLKNYISFLIKEYESLSVSESEMSDFRKRELQPIIYFMNNRDKIVKNLQNLKELLQSTDIGIQELAKQEQQELEAEIKELDKKLLLTLIPKDKDSTFDSLILEVQAGVGGQEAMLFAKEVFDMYRKFVTYKGKKIHLSSVSSLFLL